MVGLHRPWSHAMRSLRARSAACDGFSRFQRSGSLAWCRCRGIPPHRCI